MKKVIVIGAGLSGLAAGIFLAAAGVAVEILELSNSPGGLCRAWSRNGFRFDSCIQWMAGIKASDPVFALYREVGALTEDTELFRPRELSLELDGERVRIPMELTAFRDCLTAISPEDGPAINALCADAETSAHIRRLPGGDAGAAGMLARLRSGHGSQAVWRRTADRTVAEYIARFQNERIGKILTRLTPAAYSSFVMLSGLGTRLTGNAGYPLGGASGVVERMTARFETLGGTLRLGVRAEEILVSGGAVRGLRAAMTVCKAGAARAAGSREDAVPGQAEGILAAGGEGAITIIDDGIVTAGGKDRITIDADGIIAACGAHETLFGLLGGRYEHQPLCRLLRSGPLFEPMAAVSFGLCGKFDIPYMQTCQCPEGLGVAPGVRRYGFTLRSFDFDPSAAPPGCSSVMAALHVPLDYWNKLRETKPASYRLQKELLADQLAAKIDARYPGFKDAIEIVDVATPATFMRLANPYKGSLEGFAPTPEVFRMPVRKTLAGLRRLYLCSQWTSAGGGIGAAIAGGREAARRMLRELG